ncbi:hypothetical protein D9M72_309010 [compost metagenome]
MRGARAACDRHRDAVALERPQHRPYAQRPQQRHAADASGHDHHVGRHHAAGGPHAGHAPALLHQLLHDGAEAHRHAGVRPVLQQPCQRQAEAVAVAHLLARRVDGAGNLVADAGQRGLQRHAGIAVQRLLLAAQAGLVIEQAAGRCECLRVAVHHQLAAPRKIEAGAAVVMMMLFDKRLHQVARIEPQPQQLARGGLAGGGVAHPHEGRQPAPLRRICRGAETHRRIAPQQPARHLGHHARPGQRRHIAVAELPAIGKAGLLGRPVVALQHRHLVAVLGQAPCRRHADHAGAHDHYLHCHPLIALSRSGKA